MNEILHITDLLGTLVFAISGITVAVRNKLDIFGAAVVAFITALGGGTLRDLLIGNTPVTWMNDNVYVLIVGVGIVLGMAFRRQLNNWPRTFFIFDTIGIGLFTILGVEKTLSFDLPPVIALMMGTVSAVFGGVVRDVLVNRVPLIFRKEIYATSCILGGSLYLILIHCDLDRSISMFLSILLVIIVRRLAVVRNWSLPMPQ